MQIIQATAHGVHAVPVETAHVELYDFSKATIDDPSSEKHSEGTGVSQ
jgi:hypothetical protein